MSDDLGTIFEDGEPVEPVAEPEKAEVTETEPETESATEEPEMVEKQEVESTATEDTKEPQNVPLAALMAERDKRQALQRDLDTINAEKAKAPAPDVFDDQEGYTQHLNEQMSSAVFNERANMSEFMARRDFPDLDEKIATFESLKEANPALANQVYSAQSPYHEIVDIVDKHGKLEAMQNIDEVEATMRTEIEAKVRAEIKAEMEGKQQADKELRDSIPTSLVSEPSRGSVSSAAFEGQASLESILD